MRALDFLIDDEIRDVFSRIDLPVGSHGYDPWGVSPRAAMQALAVARWFYRRYFRTEVYGLENIPAGRVLIIGNHSGQLPVDGMLVGTAMALEADPPRFVRAMIERWFSRPPWVNVLMQRLGQTIGLPHHAKQLLRQEQAVLVFPEGQRGAGKVWSKRYTSVGFGQGFLRMALECDAPIVPFGLVGCEEMCPSFSRMEPLAKLFGAPYIPLTPTLVPVPFPTKVSIRFGAPMKFEGTGHEEDSEVLPMVAKVENEMLRLIGEGLEARKSVFFG